MRKVLQLKYCAKDICVCVCRKVRQERREERREYEKTRVCPRAIICPKKNHKREGDD